MKTILVDARNFDQVEPLIVSEMQAAPVRGFDIETWDDPHDALRAYRKSKRKVIFDVRRTTVAGFSLYAPKAPNAWYVNLMHKDAENRVPWSKARALLDCATSPLIIHNVPFEQTMMRNSLGYELGDTICTLQMAVSHHGPDEFDRDRMADIVDWEFRKLIPQVLQEFRGYDREISRSLNSRQEDLIAKVVGKESDAAWSYNGFAKSISYGYGLKQLAKNFLGIQMDTFEALLKRFDANDMRDLTGEQVAAYGGDDSYVAVELFYELARRMRPELLQTFREQENPMTAVFADIWSQGIHINADAVAARFVEEEEHKKQVMARMREIVQAALPFPAEPNAELMRREDWYARGWEKQRKEIIAWGPKINPSHYYKTRVLLYDLFGLKIQFDQGKVASDSEARGKMLEDATGGARDMLLAMKDLAGISQRIKLYLAPYQALIDPETSRMYPVVSSKLATRRMAASFPNPMQLAKHADGSQYIRGFYEADND